MADSSTGLVIALTAYTLVHCATYFWYQSRGARNGGSGQRTPDDDRTLRRRISSGIHRPRNRRRYVLLVTVILALAVLACLVAAAFARPVGVECPGLQEARSERTAVLPTSAQIAVDQPPRHH